MTTQKTFPWSILPRAVSDKKRTALIYYGGKSRDAQWIIKHFPPHTCFVDVFGGGGAIILAKGPGQVEVYNDIGNVSLFFQVLRDHPDELYRALYLTPFSREEFEKCTPHKPGSGTGWEESLANGDMIEFARRWYVTINQGYTHEEYSDSWHVAKQVNSASAVANHTDDLPRIADRLRRIHIEHMSFDKLIPLYDLEDGGTLFYCDPPYYGDTRVSLDTYVHEMTAQDHLMLLDMILEVKGQVVLSGYSSELYESKLADWLRVEKTAKSAIQNTRQLNGRADRTEVLWIKEHHHGFKFWSSPNVSGVPRSATDTPAVSAFRRRSTL